MVGCGGGTVVSVLQGWGTLLLAQGGIVLNLLYTAISRPLMLTVLLMLVCGALLMVTGMWLTLQFRFIQMQYPAVMLAFERQVLTASIPVAAIMQVLGVREGHLFRLDVALVRAGQDYRLNL
jgi:hypothetical protein